MQSMMQCFLKVPDCQVRTTHGLYPFFFRPSSSCCSPEDDTECTPKHRKDTALAVSNSVHGDRCKGVHTKNVFTADLSPTLDKGSVPARCALSEIKHPLCLAPLVRTLILIRAQ